MRVVPAYNHTREDSPLTPCPECATAPAPETDSAGCECGWRLPREIAANVRVKSLQLQFTCPMCDTNFMMVVKGAG